MNFHIKSSKNLFSPRIKPIIINTNFKTYGIFMSIKLEERYAIQHKEMQENNLIDGQNLSIALLHFLQLPQVIPSTSQPKKNPN